MKENIVQKLTSKDDKYACAFTDRIVAESHDTDEWYEYFEDVASLLDHPKSLVRNRALYILAANAQWDEENRFDSINLALKYPLTCGILDSKKGCDVGDIALSEVGRMCELAIRIPDAVLYDTKMTKEQALSFAKRAIALGYYTQNGVSIGYCAQIAGMTEADFIKYLSENHVSIFRFDDAAEFAEEMNNA